MVATRHTEVAQNELREEGQMKANEYHQSREAGPSFRIQPPGDFGPPEMDSPQIGHDCTANHNIVKVSDDEVSIVHMNVKPQRCQKHTCQAPNGK